MYAEKRAVSAKTRLKVIPAHTIKARTARGGLAPLILKFDNKWL